MESAPDASSIPIDDVWRPLKRLAISWTSAIEVLFSPLALILLVLTVALIYFHASANPDLLQKFPALGPLITTLSSIFAGIAGGYLEKRWSSVSEGRILVTRGKSAIRGLTLLLQNLGGLERRVAIYLERARSSKVDPSITTSYEEVISRCTALEEEAVNSIEEWQDIIPEAANVKTQIGMITTLKRDLEGYSTQVGALQSELAANQSRSKDEYQTLQTQLLQMRAKFEATNGRLKEAERKLASSPLSGLTGFQATGSQPFSIAPSIFPKITTVTKYEVPGIVTCPRCSEVQPLSPGKKCVKCGKDI